MSVFTPIPPKSTCSSAAIDCAREAAALGGRLEHRESVLSQRIADALVGRFT
jgi:hypothetical protein